MTREEQLEKVAREIENCKTCKTGKIGKPVPGEGNPNAKIVFIGEAPGYNESQTGRPFIGRSGQFLTKLLASIGLDRADVYITSPVKYYPVKKNTKNSSRKEIGRAPSDSEIEHGKLHLNQQLEVIKPKLIVLLGRVAAKALIGNNSKLLKSVHGTTIAVGDKNYFQTYHPAAALRFPKIRKLLEDDFKKLQKTVTN